jgi:phosphoribosylaminoimidazolecarboxamide formyltransferase/IMP cyclohydrolase
MRALLSVYDKTGIEALGAGLAALGYEIVSTGGTQAALEAAGVPVTPVSDVTGFPEILEGRVKTLHPRIHGGLLARHDDPMHMGALEFHEIAPIDLVAANLYPFAATVAAGNVTLAAALEQIDIGGPAMIRAAAKNFRGVVVLTDPADYDTALRELSAGGPSDERRQALAAKAFAHTAAYDAVIAEFLRQPEGWPQAVAFAGQLERALRYGENPQQQAAAYRRLRAGEPVPGVLDARQLSGKELSFNNLLDADAAWSAVGDLDGAAVAIVKHTIPCGLAVREVLADAFVEALRGDPVSAFGGIAALNRQVDGETARRMADIFIEVVIAPGFAADALETLGKKKALRLLALPSGASAASAGDWDVRPIRGGWLVQTPDAALPDRDTWQVVTARQPDEREWADLEFAWRAIRHVKSNAIVLARDRALTGVGSGQPNRLESVRIAVDKAGPRAAGSVLASDAFFPFADGLEAAIAAGVTAAVQPGGSVRDDEVIAAADRAGIAMVFTGTRHFRH